MLALALAFASAGIATAWLALSGASAGWDKAILVALRHPDNLAVGIGPSSTAALMRLLSLAGSQPALVLLSLAAAAYIYSSGRRRLALLTLGGVAGALAPSAVLKFAVMRPRPDVVPHLGAFAGPSFPSSHAMLGMAVYFVLALSLARMIDKPAWRGLLYGLATVLAIIIGCTRLYLGVHWPTDVLAGWCFGAAWALGYAALLRQALRRDHAPPCASA